MKYLTLFYKVQDLNTKGHRPFSTQPKILTEVSVQPASIINYNEPIDKGTVPKKMRLAEKDAINKKSTIFFQIA